MAIGDKSRAYQEAKLQRQREESAAREVTEVSPDDLIAQDVAEEVAAEFAATPDAPTPGPALTGLTFDQLMALVKAASHGNQLSASDMAEAIAEATRKGMEAGADRVKPKEVKLSETVRKSAYNPDGDRDHPRPKLKCYMYFGSAPIGSPKEVTTLTHAEIAALNGVTPGHYRIQKMDGSKMVIEVKGQYNANRELDRLWITLPEGDDQKNLYPPLAQFAAQCRDENRVSPEMAS